MASCKGFCWWSPPGGPDPLQDALAEIESLRAEISYLKEGVIPCLKGEVERLAGNEQQPKYDPPCETCNDDPIECAKVPGSRHCERSNR